METSHSSLAKNRKENLLVNDRKLAVTGITGKSGIYFLKEVLKHRDAFLEQFGGGIRFVTREKEKAEQIGRIIASCIPYKVIIGDIEDQDVDANLCDKCDVLLHIAGIRYSEILVNSAIEAGIKRLILVHTTGIYSKYKVAGEEYRKIDETVYKLCKKRNIVLTVLRPTMIYGSLKDNNVAFFIRLVDKLPLVPTVNGAHYQLQPVWCGDLGKAYYQVLMNEKCSGHDYDLSGGEPIELRRMLEVIAENLGVKRRFFSCPFPIAYLGAWGVYVFSLGKKDYREKVQRMVEPRAYNHDAATKDFDYNPVDFSTGIVGEIEEYKKRKAGIKQRYGGSSGLNGK